MLSLPSDTTLSVAELEQALNAAGAEDDRWEAKGTKVTAEHVSKAVAGLANRDGGVVVIGIAQTAGAWTATGLAAPADREPGRWIADALAEMKPLPAYWITIVEVDAATGTWAAAIHVDPVDRDLVVLPNGRVVRREHGRTSTVTDGATLTALVLRRAGVGVPAKLDASLDAGVLGEEFTRAVNSGEIHRARPLVAELRQALARAVEFCRDSEVATAADRLTTVAAVLSTAAPGARETAGAIAAHHDLFEQVLHVRDLPGQRARLDLFRVLRPNVLALGGLLVRLRDWDAMRRLAAYRSPLLAGHHRTWLLFIDSEQAKASALRNAETRAHPIRAAREAMMRLTALRPDHADEHQALDSILAFDFAANLVECDTAVQDGYPLEVWPAFTAFDERGVRPVAEQLLRDTEMREGLLPGRDLRSVATMLSEMDARSRAAAPESQLWGGFLSAETAGRIAQLDAGVAT